MPTPIATPDTFTPCDNPRAYKWKTHVCRCVACRDRTIVEEKQYSMRKATGKTDPLVPIGNVPDILRRLSNPRRKVRMSKAAIARYVGLHPETIRSIVNGESTTIRRSLYNKIVELEKFNSSRPLSQDEPFPDDRFRHDYMPIDMARNAIQGLMIQGYPMTWIAEQLGKHRTSHSVSSWNSPKTRYISRENYAALLELVKRVGTTPGPSNRTRIIAEKRGYVGLANWDEFF